MDPTIKARVLVRSKIHWTSASGRIVVVRGPFPDGTYRGLTSLSVRTARTGTSDGMTMRRAYDGTYYAAMLREDVIEVYDNDPGRKVESNEYGEICP